MRGLWRRFKKKSHERSLEQLLAASQRGRVEAVKRVLERGIDINARHRTSGRTALMECAAHGHVEVAEVLLSKGANVNAKSRSGGRTALMRASDNGHVEMAKFLLSHLAEIDEQDSFGKTALILATRAGHTDLVELLIKHGVDLDVRDNKGKSALEFAAEAGRNDLVRLLTDRGAGRARTGQNNNRPSTHQSLMNITRCSNATKRIQTTISNGSTVNLSKIFIPTRSRGKDCMTILFGLPVKDFRTLKKPMERS